MQIYFRVTSSVRFIFFQKVNLAERLTSAASKVLYARGRARTAKPSRPKGVTVSKWQAGLFAVAHEIAALSYREVCSEPEDTTEGSNEAKRQRRSPHEYLIKTIRKGMNKIRY